MSRFYRDPLSLSLPASFCPLCCDIIATLLPLPTQYLHLFVQSPPFFLFFQKNSPKYFASSKTCRTFALAFGKRPGLMPRRSFFARFSGAQETRSLTDCEQKKKTRQRAPYTLYIIYMEVAPSIKSFLLHKKTLNEQWSRKAWPVRQYIMI